MQTVRRIIPTATAPPVQEAGRSIDRSERAEAYCRRARRLRGRHSNSLGVLHRSLRSLAQEQDAGRAREESNVPTLLPAGLPLQSSANVADEFAREVLGVIQAGVIRYSQRQKLLRRASRLGIPRFEANLIIATLQHRAGALPEVGDEGEGVARRYRWVYALAVAAGVQVGIGVFLYNLLK